ncbi:MAG: GNAT family N-acetyltransferase [Pseudomonadota bacterium]
MHVRQAQPDDLPAMVAILNEIIAIGGTTAFEEPLDAAALGAIVFSAQRVSAFVVLDDAGVVAGFQWLARLPDLPPDLGDIASFTRRAPRLPGAGRALMAATVAAARAAGLTAINAKIRADNTVGLGYYAAMGFQDHALKKGAPLKDGTPMDRVVKRLSL